MLSLVNALIGFLLGGYVGRLLAIASYRLPLILLEEDADQEPRDLFKWFIRKSRCKNCNKELSILDNFPIGGYLILSRKCPSCNFPLEFRRFLLELIGALLFGGALFFFPLNLKLGFVLIVISLLICCFITDYDHGILPDQFTISLVWIGLISSLVPIFATPEEAIMGAAVGYGIFWLFNEIYRYFRGFDGMFPGDFKLNAALGSCLGIKWMLFIILASFVLLLLGAIVQLIRLKKSDKASILYKETPYGCYSSVVTGCVLFLALSQEA